MANTIIKSSSHHISNANTGKKEMLNIFVSDMQDAIWFFVDKLWNTRTEWDDKHGNRHIFDIKNHKYDIPAFIPTIDVIPDTPLSQRALKCAASQARGIVNSAIKKRKKQLFKLAEFMTKGADSKVYKKLQSKIDSTPINKPTRKSVKLDINLDSTCSRFDASDSNIGKFDGFLVLKSLGKKYGKIILPINITKHSNKLKSNGYLPKTTWLINTDVVNSVWEKEKPKSTGTKIVGADQGKCTTLSLSDSQVTKPNKHGRDLNIILSEMARKEEGSKSFKRKQDERTNYINWSIKQLNFTDIAELRLEKLFQMRKGKNTSSTLKHWTYTTINAQIRNVCQEHGVRVVEQSAAYRSQRCNTCGWVQKSNRCRKEFICKSCGHSHDADINGAMNHEVDLYPLPFGIWHVNLNRKGFFWTSDGIYDAHGSELTVPDMKK